METQTWTPERLQSLIDEKREESLTLEYKRGAFLTEGSKDGIAKKVAICVSAMANAAGGTIVIGIAEDKQFPTGFECIDPKAINKDRLENIILDNIQPKLQGLKIFPVNMSDGKVVYVLEVAQAEKAYMCSRDKVHYRRRNFKAEPMDAYELSDINNRVVHPNLILKNGPLPDDGFISFTIENIGYKIAKYIIIEIIVPIAYFNEHVLPKSTGSWKKTDDGRYYIALQRINLNPDRPIIPLLPTEHITLEAKFQFDYRTSYDNSLVRIIRYKIIVDENPDMGYKDLIINTLRK